MEKPYVNSDKRFVWFKFEDIIDINGYLDITSIEPFLDGMEIYAERKNRRIKPENTWVWKYQNED